MIQRKQTVFILLALLCSILSLSMPIAHFAAKDMGLGHTLLNLWLRNNADATVSFSPCVLFILQLITIPMGLFAIFQYRNRPFQARLCVLNSALLFLWYIALAVVVYLSLPAQEVFKPTLAICFPVVALVFHLMARQGIIADEKLVKAADRIR